MKLEKSRVLKIIKAALKEDVGAGDITTKALIGKFDSIKAGIFVNEDCVVCGIFIAEWTLANLDYSVRFKPQASDGDVVSKRKEIVFLEGRAQGILTAERTMLNFLSILSGIATMTKGFVEKVKPYKAKIYDTRKTLPLLRYLEKYAVSVGGGYNHRMGLWDQVLVKDNHLKTQNFLLRQGFGGQAKLKTQNLISGLRNKIQKNIRIEVEVNNLKEFEEVLKQGPDIIMLDNMNARDVKEAAGLARQKSRKTLLEVSGGITLDNVEEYAKTGVDMISIGALTDSVKSIDMSLEIIR